MKATMPLFPDMLEQADPFDRYADYLQRGFGIWSFEGGSLTRMRSEDCHEHRHLFVVFDDQRFYVDKTGEHWTVEIRHYFNSYIRKVRGKDELRQCVRYFERHFKTREEAIAMAEKLLAIFQRVNRLKKIPQQDLPDCEECEHEELVEVLK